MEKRGFTLIELLIVVAIIAILAAIAVPNFLEAQTRSKTSRALSDMRSIAVAVECYTVDYNRPVLDRFDWQNLTGSQPQHWDWVLVPLTTPVAYMTSIPEDPYTRMQEVRIGGKHTWYLTVTGYGAETYSGHNSPTDPAAMFYGPRGTYRWMLDCCGPDLYWEWDRGNDGSPLWAGDVLYYDATNGTKSQGDIYYYGPGGGPNPAPATGR